MAQETVFIKTELNRSFIECKRRVAQETSENNETALQHFVRLFEPEHDKTRLKSAWASAQSDQSSLWAN